VRVRTSRAVPFAAGIFGGLALGAISMGLFLAFGPEQFPPRVHAVQAAEPTVETPRPANLVADPAYAVTDAEVRILPASGTAVLGTMTPGERVDVFVIQDGWAAVRFPAGTSGWGWTPSSGLYWPESALGVSAREPDGTVEPVGVRSLESPRPQSQGDVVWMAAVVALGLTLLPAGLAWRLKL